MGRGTLRYVVGFQESEVTLPKPQTVNVQALPNPLNHDDLARAEEALRQLGVTKALIERCKRCNIPVSEAESDCNALCEFLTKVIAEFTGPQSPIP